MSTESKNTNEKIQQIDAHLVMIDYLIIEVAKFSRMTAFILQMARTNLFDETVAQPTTDRNKK